MSPVLRPYQQRLLEQLAATDKRILVVCPTGGGKTVVAAALMASSSRRALMVAHRREIVNQTAAKLAAFGVHHGLIQAGEEDKLRPMAAVQVASIQTLHARAIRSTTMPMPFADLIVIDEAHHACAMTYRKVIEVYPDATVLGLTATPCRGDGRGLGGIFDVIIAPRQEGVTRLPSLRDALDSIGRPAMSELRLGAETARRVYCDRRGRARSCPGWQS